MDQPNSYLTQHIVGMPMRLALGVPTAIPGDPTIGLQSSNQQGLPSKAGPWVLGTVPQRRAVGYAIGTLAFACIAIYAVYTQRPTPVVPPPLATQPPAPKSIEHPLSSIDRQASPFEEATGATTDANQPFRPAPSGVVAPVPADALAVRPPDKVAAKSLPTPTTPAKPVTRSEPEQVKAVILDAAAPKSAEKTKAVAVEPKPVPANLASPPPAQPSKATSTPATTVAKGDVERPDNVTTKITIVDIAVDGSYVLITDPQTRLPKKYSAGQKIFTGEQILKIEPDKSRIQLTSRYVAVQ